MYSSLLIYWRIILSEERKNEREREKERYGDSLWGIKNLREKTYRDLIFRMCYFILDADTQPVTLDG